MSLRHSPFLRGEIKRDALIGGKFAIVYLFLSHLSRYEKNNRKGMLLLKEITKNEMQKLIDSGLITNTDRGYVNKNGHRIGYYKTKGSAHKRYIEDYYANKAKEL